jgi:hypothetical protein
VHLSFQHTQTPEVRAFQSTSNPTRAKKSVKNVGNTKRLCVGVRIRLTSTPSISKWWVRNSQGRLSPPRHVALNPPQWRRHQEKQRRSADYADVADLNFKICVLCEICG